MNQSPIDLMKESKCPLVRNGTIKRKGETSVEWWENGKPMRYCHGYKDDMTDELLNECEQCANHVSKAQSDLLQEMMKKQPEIIRCKDCKYYESVDGIFPVCNKLAKGCQTEPDGYCFLGENTVKELLCRFS